MAITETDLNELLAAVRADCDIDVVHQGVARIDATVTARSVPTDSSGRSVSCR